MNSNDEKISHSEKLSESVENSLKNLPPKTYLRMKYFFRYIKRFFRLPQRLLSDEKYLKRLYLKVFSKPLNLENPNGFTEKLQWLKIHNRKPVYTTMVDKYEAKKFIAERIGEEYIVPIYGVWERFNDIDFSSLPQSFVLKSTHDSGGLYICKEKEKMNKDTARVLMNFSLNNNHFWKSREWPYKNVRPRIFAEKYLENPEIESIRDYKFFTFGGIPKVMYVTSGRNGGETYADFFDMDWNHLDLTIDHRNAPTPPQKPVNFEKMKEFAAVLSEGTPHLRVDFYEIDGKLYAGELTFFHCSGLCMPKPSKWETQMGEWIELPKV